MRAVVQRVRSAEVRVDDAVVGSVGTGLLVLLGVSHGDTRRDAEAVAAKIAGLRVFADADGRMNLDVAAAGGGVLLVSQFTLLADVRRGRRPSFAAAAAPEHAVELIDVVAHRLGDTGLPVEMGEFGAHMQVHLVNDGPVTIVVDSAEGTIA